MNFRKILKGAVLTASLMSLVGCATMFGVDNNNVQVASDPSNADLYLNGAKVGRTPFSVPVANPMHENMLTLKKAGYSDTVRPVETEFQTVGWWNLLVWPGFIIDWLTGNMMRVKPNMMVNMQAD